MNVAYCDLHSKGYAHSIEVWSNVDLAGGIYGVVLGRQFYAESMVSCHTNGSKVALMALCQLLEAWNFDFIECQFPSPHLRALGSRAIPRSEYLSFVKANRKVETCIGPWQVEPFRVTHR